MSWVDSITERHSQNMLNTDISRVNTGTLSNEKVRMSTHERHTIGRKYRPAFKAVCLKRREVRMTPIRRAFHIPAAKSTAIATVTPM